LAADRDALDEVRAVVRRALAARTNDQHLIDDLTQETILRVTRSARQLSDDERRAYAVVTARNLLVSHHRARSVHDRHLHRLVQYESATDPEQRTIDKEESEALAAAMTRIDPDERELLVRHEVSGTDLATLADEANVTRGAIAMRLARARANLRLEFLLVFRRLRLPTERCRPVLLAIAAGDRRRQTQLDAEGHVESCEVCATLVEPMTERDRRVAGWLFVPVADAVRRVQRAFHDHWLQVASAVIVAVGAGGLFLLVTSDHRADAPAGAATTQPVRPTSVAATTAGPTSAPPAAPAPITQATTAPPTTTPAPAVVPTQAAPAAPAPPPPTVTEAPTTATTACPSPRPLSEIDVGASLGCRFAVSVVTVVGLSSGTNLSAVTDSQRVVSIYVLGGALPALTIVPGARISISGVIEGGSAEQVSVEVHAADLQLVG
jgi:RNA polymerase sigma factor (sigma-70 family)